MCNDVKSGRISTTGSPFWLAGFDIPLQGGRDEKSYAVYGCPFPVCVFPLGCCIVLHRREAPKSAGLLLLCQQLRKLYSLQHLHENSHILSRLVPEQIPFKHSCEGPDDMPAHAKVMILRALISLCSLLSTQACLLGSNLTLPICDGRVTLGTWQVLTLQSLRFQGVWLCEHRDRAGPRKVLVTVNGVIRDPIRCFSASSAPRFSSVNTSLITVLRYIGFIQVHPNEL